MAVGAGSAASGGGSAAVVIGNAQPAGLSNNSKGNASTCIAANGCTASGTLPCRGRATFDETYAAFKKLLIGTWRRDEIAAREAAE